MIAVLYNKDDFIPHQEYTLFFTLNKSKARAYENINKSQLNSVQPQNILHSMHTRYACIFFAMINNKMFKKKVTK